MTLYEIKDMYLTVLEMATDPEIDPQAVTDTLEALDGDFEYKADNYAKIKTELEATAAALKVEEMRIRARRLHIEKNIERLKASLFDAMKATGKTKFKTDLFTFGIVKNGGKLPVILDVPVDKLPPTYVKVVKSPDMDAIRARLDEVNGESFYAHYGERGESLRIK